MPARKKKEEQINLLPQKGFQASTAGRLLSWILSTFRVIVIVTEIIVMIAFLSRFYFDAQNSDLNEEIDHKQAVLSAARDFEGKYKDVQNRLRLFSAIISEETPYSVILTSVKSSVPADVVLTSVSGEKNSFKIIGITPNGRSIQQFIVNLGQNKSFTEIILYKAGTKSGNPGIIEFEIQVTGESDNKA